jgi:hypothetical protein
MATTVTQVQLRDKPKLDRICRETTAIAVNIEQVVLPRQTPR